MAKRKRGKRKGFKLHLENNYQSERYTMYVMSAETGLLQAGTIHSELTDGDVYEALENLMERLKTPEIFTELFSDQATDDSQGDDDSEAPNMIGYLVIMNLKHAFEQHGSLTAEDVIGILGVIKTSVKRHSVGMHRRGYLTFIEGFLGGMGINVQKLSAEEAEELGLDAPPNLIEGDYDEIE